MNLTYANDDPRRAMTDMLIISSTTSWPNTPVREQSQGTLLFLPFRIRPCAPFPSELSGTMDLYKQLVRHLGRVIGHLARPLYIQDNINTEESGQTSKPWVGFEPTIPVFERTKTFDALDRAATVMGTRHTVAWKWNPKSHDHLCSSNDEWLRWNRLPCYNSPIILVVVQHIQPSKLDRWQRI
jgi:hypothetical protein